MAPSVPLIADLLANGGSDDWFSEIYLDPPFPINEFIAEGRTWASRCRDDMAFESQTTIDAAIARRPVMARFFRSDIPGQYEGMRRVARRHRRSGKSRVSRQRPAGPLAPRSIRRGGGLGADPGTRLATSKTAGGSRFPNLGHGVSFSFIGLDVSCPASITTAFLAHPGDEPDGSCIDDMPPIGLRDLGFRWVVRGPAGTRSRASTGALSWRRPARPSARDRSRRRHAHDASGSDT